MVVRGGGAPADTGRLADELRQLMTLRSRSSVRDRACPVLDELLEPGERSVRDTRYVAVTRLIDEAIGDIADADHRFAAAALLGSGEGRWRTVSQRGGDAAAAFGCGWDAYRRRRTTGASQLDDTLQALAEAMVRAAGVRSGTTAVEAPDVDRPATHRAAPAPVSAVRIGPDLGTDRPPAPVDEHPHEPAVPAGDDAVGSERPPHRRGGRRAPLVLAGVLLLAVAVGVGLQITQTSSDAAPANPTCNILDRTVGALPAGADDGLREWGRRFRALDRTLPPGHIECAGTLERQPGIVLQPVAAENEEGMGAIVAADVPGAMPLLLDPQEAANYRRMRDRYGVEMVGTPLRRDDRGAIRVVRLTRGAIVGEGGGSAAFMVVGRAWLEWIRRGELDGEMGAPIGASQDRTGQRVQDFEHGRLLFDLADPDGVQWEPVPNPSTHLPSEIADSIVKAGDGTAWFVDDDLVRHWLPTVNDYGCSTEVATETFEVPAQAIMTLTVGEPFRCR